MRLRVQRAGMTYLLTNVGFSFLALNMLGAPEGVWAVLQKIFLRSLGGIVFPVLYVAAITLTTIFFIKKENFTRKELYTSSSFILVLLVGLYIVSLFFLGEMGSMVILTGIAHFAGLASISQSLMMIAPLFAFPLGVILGYYIAGGTDEEQKELSKQKKKSNGTKRNKPKDTKTKNKKKK